MKRIHKLSLGLLPNLLLGLVFLLGMGITFELSHRQLHDFIMQDAQRRAHLLQDYSLAVHTYFNHQLLPAIYSQLAQDTRTPEFNPVWMSSSHAVTQIQQYLLKLTDTPYYYKEAAINARNPANEADRYERHFLQRLNRDAELMENTRMTHFQGEQFLQVLHRGKTMEDGCTRCHTDPALAPAGLLERYGDDRSFNRPLGEVVSALSIRIPVSELNAAVHDHLLRLSLFALALLSLLFISHYLIFRHFVLAPIVALRNRAQDISRDDRHLDDPLPLPPGRELRDLVQSFNALSVRLRTAREQMEERIHQRTTELTATNQLLEREITARKYMEQRLQLTQFAMDRAGDAVFWIAPDSHFIYVNEAACTSLGYSQEELLAMRVGDVDALHTTEQIITHWEREVKPQRIVSFESLHRRKDGSTFPVEITANYLKHQGQEYNCAYARDITERKFVEQQLRNNRARLDFLLTSTPAVIFSIALAGEPHLVFMGPSVERLLGYSPESLMQDPEKWLELVHEEDRAATRDYRTAATQGRRENHEYRIRNSAGDYRWIFEEVQLVHDEHNEARELVGFWIDINERKIAEQLLAESLKEKDVLLREVHHRVKNNLQVVASLLYLEAETTRGSAARQSLQQSRDRIRALALVHELLYLDQHLHTIALKPYLQRLAAQLISSYVSGTRIRFRIDGEAGSMSPDQVILCGLISTELLTNALLHAFPDDRPGHIAITISQAEGNFRLEVQDDGIGITAQQQACHSLGLRLVQRLARQLNGQVKIDRLNPGTRVVISCSEDTPHD